MAPAPSPQFRPSLLGRCVGAVLAAALAAPVAHAATAPEATATGAAAALAAMPAPPDILGYVEIPDILRLLDHAEAVARKVSPMPIAPGLFRQQVGQTLGDPDFAHLDATRPLVFLFTRPRVGAGSPGVSLWVPTKDATPYVEKANQSIFVHAQVVNAEGVFSLDADALDQAVADKEFYDALVTSAATAPVTADLRVRASLERIDVTWHDAARESLAKLTLPKPPGGKNGDFDPTPVLRAEGYAGLALLAQCADQQVDIVLDADTIQVDSQVTAKAGSDLALAFAKPGVDAATVAKVLGKEAAKVEGAAAMTVIGTYNVAGTTKVIADVLDAAAAEPAFASLHSATISAILGDYPKAFDGAIAMRMGADGDLPLANTLVAGTHDPAAAKRVWEGAIALMSAARVGIISTIIPDVRSSHGVPVQRQHVAVDPDHGMFGSTDPTQQAMMAASLHDMELAFTPTLILGAQVPGHLDALIGAAQSSAPLPEWTTAAAAAIGPGQDGYADYDLAALMKASAKMSGTAAAPGPDFSTLPTGHPLLFAWKNDHGANRVAMRIPVQVFKDFSDAAGKGQHQRKRHAPADEHVEAPIDGGGPNAMPDASGTASGPANPPATTTPP